MTDIDQRAADVASVAERADGFRHSREARRSALTEDYVEMVAELIATVGEARSVALACRFGVTQATVAKMVARLKRESLVQAERYGTIRLTPAGERLAEWARMRHQTVVDFLKHIGVSPDVAERDAEGIEHHVSDETLDCFARLTSR